MKKASVVALIVLLVAAVAAAGPYYKDKPPTGRLLTGKVLDHQDSALAGAIVYLTNTRTRAVKTYIAGKEGEYRFPELSPNIDYEVYAQYNGRRSDTKTLSQFDNRSQANIVLHIDTK